MTENQQTLIQRYKDEFKAATGGMIEIKMLDRWDELCHVDQIPFWTVCKMIFDMTGWTRNKTFSKSQQREPISRRQVVDLIAMSNGGKLTKIARETGRDHTTVLWSVRRAKDTIDQDFFYRTLVREIMQFIRENYYLYKDRQITKEDC